MGTDRFAALLREIDRNICICRAAIADGTALDAAGNVAEQYRGIFHEVDVQECLLEDAESAAMRGEPLTEAQRVLMFEGWGDEVDWPSPSNPRGTIHEAPHEA